MTRCPPPLRAAALLALALLPQGLSAQARLTGADLQGTVTDATAGVLPGATVTVANVETGLVRTAVADQQGRYLAPALPPGTYRVSAVLDGFAPSTREGLVLVLGQLADVDFALTVAGGESVTVTDVGPVVDPRNTAVSTVVGSRQIESLPINGRNFISFSVITPGVTTDRTPQTGAAGTSGLSFGGQRARSNNIMVDGLDNNDLVVGAVRATFSQEAIREFQVLTNSYSAEFGKAAGGVVNIVTKSGTNDLHGNLFYYYRDESLNSKDHFEKFDVFGTRVNREKAPFSQNQWGATLGGPLRKDRTFFFLSFERADVQANNFVNIDPAAAAVLERAGFPVQLGNVPFNFEATEFLAKVDHQWSPNHSLALRGNFSDTTNENIEPWGGLVARSRGAVQLRKDWALSASQTDILSRSWVNEARIQFARQDQEINSLDPTCNGPCDLNDEGGPTLEVTGVALVGRQRFTPQPRLNDRLQVTETLSFFGGRHAVKAGLDFNYIDFKEQALPLHFGGRYIFSSLPAIPGVLPTPITAIQAVALGLPAAYVQGYGQAGTNYTYQDVSLFIQDEWRVSPKLTIKPGVRYQRQLWPKSNYTVSSVGDSSFSYDFPSDGDNVSPRVAVAWDPKGDGRTSIHGAWGLFYDNHITAIVGITRGINGRDGVRTLVQTFPASLPAWRVPNGSHKLPEPTTPYPSLVISIDPGLKTPWSQQAALGVDRALGEFSVAANFVWVRGKHQLGSIDYNPTLPSLGAGRRPNDIGSRAGTSATVLQYTSYAESWYRGLTLSVSKRFTRNYQLLAAYTLSEAEDISTDFQSIFPQDMGRGRDPNNLTGLPLGFDPLAEKGPASHDQRHRFVLSGLVRFPWDVQLSTIVTAASGRPYTALAGADLNGDGNGGGTPFDRARRTPADPGSSMGRNTETMEGQFNVDLRLTKRFKLGGTAALEAIAEAFNLLDRTNYSEINHIFGRGAFPNQPQTDAQGRVTYGLYEQALPPRQVQLALKLSF
jgi:hypothetical protein